MMRLALSTLRSRKGSFIGTFIASVLAIALIASCGMLMESALRGNPGADRFTASDLVVTADRNIEITQSDGDKKHKGIEGLPTLPPELADRLAKVPGVAQVVPDQSFYAQPLDSLGRPVQGMNGSPTMGHDWMSAELAPFTLREGQEPSQGGIVLDADLAKRAGASIGGKINIATATNVEAFKVTGIAAPAGMEALPTQGAIFFASADVERLAGGEPTAIGVFVDSGVSPGELSKAIQAEANDISLYRGTNRSRADSPAVLVSYAGAISVFGIMGAVSVFAAIFVIAGTVAFSVQQRLRELALLRTIGATPKQLRRMISAETLMIAVVSAIIGCPLGMLLAGIIGDGFRDIGVVPIQFQLKIGPFPLLIAVVVGIIVTQIAARAAAGRGSRIAPTQALRESIADPRGLNAVKIAAGLIFIGGAVAVLLFTPLGGSDGTGIGMGFIACFLFIIAAALWGPMLVRTVGTFIGRVIRIFSGVTGSLAAANTTARAGRMASAAMPLALLVALNGTTLLTSSLLSRAELSEQKERTAASYVLTAQSAPGLPQNVFSAVTKVPGVKDATASLATTVMVQNGDKLKKVKAQGLNSTGSEPSLELGVQDGSLSDLSSGTVAVSLELANQKNWKVGNKVSFWLADGRQVEMRVAAIYALSRGIGDIILPWQMASEHDPLKLMGSVYVRGESGSDASQLSRELASLQDGWPHLRVIEPAESQVNGSGKVSSQQAAFYLLVIILAGFTAIAVVNTFAMATSVRKREFNDLRLAGATANQIRNMAGLETVIVVLIGLLIGCVITSGVVGAFSIAQDGVWRWIVDPMLYGGLILIAAVLGLISGLIPARLAVRHISKI